MFKSCYDNNGHKKDKEYVLVIQYRFLSIFKEKKGIPMRETKLQLL